MALNITVMQVLFLLIAISVSKFIFVFHLKNPMAIQEDFFYFFINVCSFMHSFLSQFAFTALPGRDPLMFYICLGAFPAKDIPVDAPVKINYPVYGLLLLAITTHIYVGIKLKAARGQCYETFTAVSYTFS